MIEHGEQRYIKLKKTNEKDNSVLLAHMHIRFCTKHTMT